MEASDEEEPVLKVDKKVKPKKRKAPKIYKVKDLDGDERFKDIHPNLPQCPSCLILVGAIKSSKSNLICNMLMSPEMFKDKFDIVRVLSTTLHMDDKGKLLNKYLYVSILSYVTKYDSILHHSSGVGLYNEIISFIKFALIFLCLLFVG